MSCVSDDSVGSLVLWIEVSELFKVGLGVVVFKGPVEGCKLGAFALSKVGLSVIGAFKGLTVG